MAKKSKKRELIEWILLLSVALALYTTGYHKEVIGFLQRGVLATGIFKPDTAVEEKIKADYNIRLTNIAGKPIEFSEFKGKTVFINFWATWCPPCTAELPDIEKLYESTKNEVAYVMVSLDQNRFKARKYIQDKEFDFPVYFLESGLPGTYDTRSIPTTYVLSPEGFIAAERHGMAKYNTHEFREFLMNL